MDITVEKATQNLAEYDAALTTSSDNVEEVRDTVDDTVTSLKVINRGLEQVVEFRDAVSSFGDDLGKLRLVLDLMDKSGPLKFVAKVGERIVKKVKDASDRIEKKLDRVVDRIEKSPAKKKLEDIIENLEDFEDMLLVTQIEIDAHQETFGSVVAAANAAQTFSPKPIQTAGQLVQTPLDLLTDVNATYATLKDCLDVFNVDTPDASFSALLRAESAMDKVLSSIDFLRGPLDDIYGVLKPIEPLLGIVGFIASFTVDPVINWILSTIGIDDLIKKAENEIVKLLPNADVLDGLADSYDQVVSALEDFDPLTPGLPTFDHDDSATTPEVPDPFGLGQWIANELREKLTKVVQDTFGSVSAQGIGLAIEIPTGVRGADTDENLLAEIPGTGVAIEDLIMVGNNADNVITARGGKNVLVGAGGDDTLIGGTQDDMAVFTGAIQDYRFSRADAAAPVVVEHVSGSPGLPLDGRDTLKDVEKVIFLGGTTGAVVELTVEDLFGRVIQSNVQDSSGSTEDLFLIGTGLNATLIGGEGNDNISGTPGNDLMRGNGGNDVFNGRNGNDTVDGGAGNDTFVYYDDGKGGGNKVHVDLVTPVDSRSGAHFQINGTAEAILTDVENVTVEDRRQTLMFGDDKDNALAAADLDDFIDGRGGNDFLSGGGGVDILIGGTGQDTLFGGGGNDHLLAGDKAVSGGGQFYDGGEGLQDSVNYSTDIKPLVDIIRKGSDFSFVTNRGGTREASGPVRVLGDGRIERLSADGSTVLATDTAVNVEAYVGSDANDTLFGAEATSDPLFSLAGAGGDDVIYARQTSGLVDATEGMDTVFAGTGGANYEGSLDAVLNLTEAGNVRWKAESTSTSSQLRAFDAGDKQNVASGSTTSDFFSGGRLDEFGTFIGSAFDDDFDFERGQQIEIRAGAGNDNIFVNGSNTDFHRVFGEDGDDIIQANQKAIIDGGNGNDEIILITPNAQVNAGAGDDFVSVRSASSGSHYDGGEDPVGADGKAVDDLDYISADRLNPLSGLRIDLAGGTLKGMNPLHVSDGTIANFEGAIGSDEHADRLGGDAAGNVLIGGGGNDLLEGVTGLQALGGSAGPSGNDLLYGGKGHDTLLGGDGDDLLHGGEGRDLLDGGSGLDTASYALAAPGADRAKTEGASEDAVEAGVRVNLAAGTASANVAGATTTDTLVNIDNAIGTAASDHIIGNDSQNRLDGGEGADLIEAHGGDDHIAILGDDTGDGGSGDDYFVLGAGNAHIMGGSGQDTLEFDPAGVFTFDEENGTYTSEFVERVAVWANVDDDGTGVGTMTTRMLGTTSLTPQAVLEADPAFANSADDFTRFVPNTPKFEITFRDEVRTFSGTFAGIETFVRSDPIAVTKLVSGGPDEDRLVGSDEAERLEGAAGNDTIEAGGGNDIVAPGEGNDLVTLGAGKDEVNGDDDMLLGDTITDFFAEDTIVFEGRSYGRGTVTVEAARTLLGVDTNKDGTSDGAITLTGDFSGGAFMFVERDGDTRVTFETFLPGLSEGQAVAAAQINGIINQEFLTGTGSIGFKIDLIAGQSQAAFNSALGVYEVDSSGNIVDVRLLMNATASDTDLSASVTGVESGHSLGFFLVQGGANWAEGLAATDTLAFTDGPGGSAATTNSGSDVTLTVNGADAEQIVFHSFDASLNSDGLTTLCPASHPTATGLSSALRI